VTDPNYQGSATGTFTINQAAATVTFSNLTPTYTGSPLSPTVATVPSGLSFTLSGAPDTNAGSYPVTATVTDPNYQGTASGTFTINKAAATVTLGNLTQTYTGSALTPTATTSPTNLNITWTNAPDTNAGSYSVTATVNDPNYQGSGTGTFTINQAPLIITASSGSMTYGGSPFVVGPLYSGFVTGQGSNNLTTQPVCLPVFSSSTATGTYPTSCSGAVDSNYSISYTPGAVTVTQAATTTAVVSSVNPSTFMQLVTFTATVADSSQGSTGAPTGTVTFSNTYNGTTTVLCQGTALSVVNSADVATCSATTLGDQYPDNITVAYSGDQNFYASAAGGSTATGITQTVSPAPNVSLNPLFLSFGNQNVNTTSKAATVTLTNIGDANLSISTNGISITGTNYNEFSETNNCPASLGYTAPNNSCTISVTFTPVDTGVATASLQLTDNDDDTSGAQQTVSLTGAGLSTIAGTSLYTDAIFATSSNCGALTLSGGSTVDSFNSAQGYGQSHVLSGGNVGTDGNVTLNGSNAEIYGTAYAPSATTGNCSKSGVTGLTTTGGAKATGGVVAEGQVTYPNPPAPSPAPPTTTQNISGSCPSGMTGCSNNGTKNVILAPGNYGNVTVSGGTTMNVSNGTYNLNSLTLSGKSILYVTSGPVVINLAGASLSGANPTMDVSGGSIQNPTGIPANLQFTYAGSRGVNLSGGSGSYATVYAPNALVNMSGGTDFFGSVIGSTITNSGGTAMHYDTALPNIQGGSYIWFNAIVNNVSGLPKSGQVKLYLTNSTINFTANGTPYSVPVPNAVVTFNSVSTGGLKTSYDLTNSRWSTSIPAGSLTGNTFVTGVAFQVPSNFATGVQKRAVFSSILNRYAGHQLAVAVGRSSVHVLQHDLRNQHQQ
jgi:hypothetical protein